MAYQPGVDLPQSKPIKLQTGPVPWPLPPGARVIHRCDVVIPYSLVNFRWVTQSVESILNQSYVDCVIHLIQDGPLECTPENQHIHRRIELLCGLPQIRWYRNEESVGPYISVHRVWECMETEFLAIQDSDDIALPDRLWYSIETLRMTGGDIFGAAMEQFLSHEAESEAMVKRLAAQPFLTSGARGGLSIDGSLVNGTMVCRRVAFERINGFLPLKCSADLELPARAHRAGLGVVLVSHVVALRRLHSTSLSNDLYGPDSVLREEIWAHIEQVYEQYDEPGVDYAKFGGLERDRDNPATIRLIVQSSELSGESQPQEEKEIGPPTLRQEKSILSGYDQYYAGVGSTVKLSTASAEIKRIAKRLDWSLGRRILDLGCGQGIHTEALRVLGFGATGVDMSSVGISRAKAASDALFICADATVWEPEALFDTIYCREMSWFHYELDGINKKGIDVPRETARFFSWLSPGGEFVLQIRTDFSGAYRSSGSLNNTVDAYQDLFASLGDVKWVCDWQGEPIKTGRTPATGIIIATEKKISS